jgi:hypothetical protein
VPAWAHGTDGVGPALLSPDGAPVWWLLMDGYVYDIRDDLGGSCRAWWYPATSRTVTAGRG